MRRFIAVLAVVTTSMVAIAPMSDAAPEQRGCCSHHHGVCGCSGGRTVCCDNTLSPTCHC